MKLDIDFTDKQKAALLAVKNIEKEAEAISEYLPLVFICEKMGKTKAASLFKEIIADEKNHLLLTMAALQEFDGGIEIAPDGIREVFKKLQDNLGDK